MASDELRSHIANFSHIEDDIALLCRGLIYIREFSACLDTSPRAGELHALSIHALQEMARIRKDLCCFSGQASRGQISTDLKALGEMLRERQPHTDAELSFDSAVSQTIPLCAKVITGLEYVIRVYEMDRQAFSASSHEPWYATIHENSLRRASSAQSAIKALQAVTLS